MKSLSIMAILAGTSLFMLFELRFLIRLTRAPEVLGLSYHKAMAWKKHFFKLLLAGIFSVLFWIVAAIGMSGSVKTSRYISRDIAGRELVFVLDVSNSMLSPMDGSSSRLQKAVDYIRAMAAAMNGSSLSLVVFKGKAVSLCPFTNSFDAFEEALLWADPKAVSSAGSNVGAGISEAMRTDIAPGTQRLLVVLSDGNDTGGKARLEAEKAKKAGAKLVFIGFGSIESTPVFDSMQRAVLSRSGKQVFTAQDSASIQLWADASRSPYLDSAAPGSLALAMDALADSFEGLDVSILNGKNGVKANIRVEHDAGETLALFAMLFMALAFVLSVQTPAKAAKKTHAKAIRHE